ncbi:MAG: cell wall-binding repeat-containing protein, partial [Candidatus Hydrothermarchaeales archaeon]
EEAMDWILEYRPRDIIIVGGPKAVSKEVEARLATKGNVVRIYGETRIETALALAEDLHAEEWKYRVIVITDYEKPEVDAALMAYHFDAPLLYVKSTGLSPEVRDFIIEHKETIYGPTKVVLMGIDPKVASEINEILE